MRLLHLLLPLLPQFACALGTLRSGGHFACKAFDLFTPFSAGLLYIMHRCFESVCVYAAAKHPPTATARLPTCMPLQPRLRIPPAWQLVVHGSLHARQQRRPSRPRRRAASWHPHSPLVVVGLGLGRYKPAASRPANSERYVVCKGLREPNGGAAFNHLLAVNDRLNALKRSWKSEGAPGPGTDVVHLAPPELLQQPPFGPCAAAAAARTAWRRT